MLAQLDLKKANTQSLAMPALFTEAYNAQTAWRCALSCDALAAEKFASANVGVVGVNQQAIGARFT